VTKLEHTRLSPSATFKDQIQNSQALFGYVIESSDCHISLPEFTRQQQFSCHKFRGNNISTGTDTTRNNCLTAWIPRPLLFFFGEKAWHQDVLDETPSFSKPDNLLRVR